uniref:LRAT domain-containing protein n=1 Tax=Sinocyclocheilus rhinocerous TaxID=307959 RepID=A0A673I5P9_9TELE
QLILLCYRENYTSCSEKRGDLIEISRKGYQHWTIYAGDGYVIHLVKDRDHDCFYFSISFSIEHSDAGATVKKEKLEDVADNDEYRINNHLDDQYKPRPIEDILQEAENLVGREFPYNLLSSNCEHFVTLLRYGNPLSQQVQFKYITASVGNYRLTLARFTTVSV